jgi:hypothetical protein
MRVDLRGRAQSGVAQLRLRRLMRFAEITEQSCVSMPEAVPLDALRRLGLAGTAWAEAQGETIRLRLLKIAAQVRITARRIWVRYNSAYPWQNIFGAAWTALRC